MEYLGPYALGPNETQWQGIYTGDARVLAKYIPDESVDLIFTDPVYERIEDYRWLAETAKRVLKPGGALLVCYGIGYLPETLAALSSALQYRWNFVVYKPNAPSTRGAYRVFSKWWGVAWYDVEGSKPEKHVPDVITSNGGGSVRWMDTFKANDHVWVKNPEPIAYWVEHFTPQGATVLDPFAGGGTVAAVCKQLGRRCLSFEIDQGRAINARVRVCNTQPPLFVLDAPKQLSLIA